MNGRAVPNLDHCVVDASVLIKVVLPEEGTPAARKLLDPRSGSLGRSVPTLVYVECANILWKHVRFRGLDGTVAWDSLAGLLALPLQVWPVENLIGSALMLALVHRTSVYDALYLALADLLDSPLVTADAALVSKVAGSNLRLVLLDDI